MAAERILVINPNSTVAVTAAIDRAVAPLRMAGGPEIACLMPSLLIGISSGAACGFNRGSVQPWEEAG